MKSNKVNKVADGNQYELFISVKELNEEQIIGFIKENLLQKTNGEIAQDLQLTLGKVRHIQRKYNLIRNDEESRAIRSKLSQEQSGSRNPNWRGGISKDSMRYKRLQMERHPIHVEARRLARKALKNGVITKKPCEVCSSENSQMHHEDYFQPLEVVFLCKNHHSIVDRYLKQGIKFLEIKNQLILEYRKAI